MNGSLSHFKAMSQRRNERKDTNAHKFTKGRERFTSTSANFNFPTLEKEAQLKLQACIKKRLTKEQRNRNVKTLLLTLTVISIVIVAWKFL
jgi:hypothetical protein